MNNNTDTRSQMRKTNKPLTERRRRERINKSLQQLKQLVLRAANKDDNVKLEKADVMEMTVRYLEDVCQKQIAEDRDNAQLTVNSYIQGYSSCLKEVSAVLSTPYISDEVRSTVSSHMTTNFYALTNKCQTQGDSTMLQELHNTQFQVSSINQGRVTTSTHISSRADESQLNQLSPRLDSRRQDSPSPSSWQNFTDTISYATSPGTISYATSPGTQRLYSPSAISDLSDSGVESSDNDNSLWRPW